MAQFINHVEVIRDSTNQLTITFNSYVSSAIAIYWSTEANTATKNKHLLSENVTNSITFSDPLNAERRIYFIFSTEGYPPYLFGERTLPTKGINNFRDYGGYYGANGKRVKWGMLYRSNHLYNLDPQAANYIEQLNIQSIIDYRSKNEIFKCPNDSVGEKVTYNFDPSAHTAELAAQFSAKQSDENRALIDNIINNISKEHINGKGNQVLEQYRNFVLNDKAKLAFKNMINVLLDKNNAPNIQHCRGGKDRTGYGVLLILTMLGVSKQDIIDDYMVTKANRLTRNEFKMAQYREITNDENILAYLLSLIDTREYFLEEAFKAIESVSDSAEHYIKDILGFTDQDFLTMQANYLE